VSINLIYIPVYLPKISSPGLEHFSSLYNIIRWYHSSILEHGSLHRGYFSFLQLHIFSRVHLGSKYILNGEKKKIIQSCGSVLSEAMWTEAMWTVLQPTKVAVLW